MKKIISVIMLIAVLSNVGIVPVCAVYTSTNDGYIVANYAKAAVGTHEMSRKGLCQTFAWECLYNTLGVSNKAGCGCCATKAWQSYGVSSSRDNIPLGAAVYFGGSSTIDSVCGQEAGHVGIYIGNNEIAHAWSSKIICKTTIDYVINCGYYYRGWGWQGGYPLATETPAFRGCVDNCDGGIESISVYGWTFYTKDTSASIEAHVYIGGPHDDTSAEGHVVYANVYRPDVNSVYGCGDYHGFSEIISTKKTGTQDVYIYAVNGSEHELLGTYSVTIMPDNISPIIEKIWFTDLNEDSYTINLTASDNINVQTIGFLPWGAEGDSSDNIWHPISTSGKIAQASQIVRISDHNNETGTYYAEVSAYDDNWNTAKIRMDYGVFVGEYKNLGDDFYAYIVNTMFNKAVTCSDSGNIYSSTFNKSDNQLWRFEKMDDKSYVITNAKTKLALDVDGGSTELCAKLKGHVKHCGSNQRWFIQGHENDYRLRAKSGWCVLDLYGCNTNDGAEFCMYGSNNSSAQLFGIVKEKANIKASVTKNKNNLVVSSELYNIYDNHTIIVAGYKDKKMIDMTQTTQGVPATLSGDIDEIKVMVWNSLSNMVPLCDAEVIPSSEFILE